MSPEYLYQLAELADPDELWRQGGLTPRMSRPEKERQQMDTGVALRRYASHLEDVRRAFDEQKSVLITPLSSCGTAKAIIDTPEQHQRLRDCRAKAAGSDVEPIPTQVTIAPRGYSWHGDRLMHDELGTVMRQQARGGD